MITEFGMSESMTPRTYGEHEEMIFLGKEIHYQRDYSEKVAQEIDVEVAKLIEGGKSQAERLIREHRGKLEKIVETLLAKETIEREEFEALMKA